MRSADAALIAPMGSIDRPSDPMLPATRTGRPDALRASTSSEDVTARLLAIAGIRGDGAATVIVGRAFNEVSPEAGCRRPQVREAVVALSAMVVATLVAIFMLHAMFSPT